jgi:hypothetical protein
VADEPQQPAAAGSTETAPLESRVGEIERKQDRQDGKLDRIIEMLPGVGSAGGGEPVTRADEPPASAADMAEQVRQAVRDVNAESASKEPSRPAPEMTPREVGIEGKQKLQAWLFGGDPKK